MTRDQYIEMAEHFARYANTEVTYKSMNTYYGYGYGKISERKYNIKTAVLVGVGILGNTEHFILQQSVGGHIAIHYRDITFPTKH